MPDRIRLMLADEHALMRDGIRHIMMQHDDLEVVGEAADGRELLKKARKLKPAVVVLDVSMPRISGFEVLPMLKEFLPRLQVVMLSLCEREDYVHRGLSAGALGFVLKSDSSRELLTAVRKAAVGQYYLSPALNAEVINSYISPDNGLNHERPGYDSLTNREKQVFRLVAEGHTTKQIAADLFISPRTVDKHRANIAQKLDIRDTPSLVHYAIKIGVVDPELLA